MAVSMEMIKELKDKTGAGVMDCKAVLNETGGDMTKAVDILRKKGLNKADKKADRAANEGFVVYRVSGDNKKGLVIKLNCETDFVAKTDDFRKFCDDAADLVMKKGVPFAKELPADLDELRRNVVAKVGENILVSDWKFLDAKGKVFPYIHLNKVGVIVDFDFSKDVTKDADTEQFMKNIAMQITAMNPVAVTSDGIPADVLAAQKETFMEEARATGKPENVLPKIVEGKFKKFYEESILFEQCYILDEEKRVKDIVSDFSKAKGVDVKVVSFVRISL
ncbi:MAG: translation elongation factor Ts [Spirochaetes bacterium GWF1_51_8]|nr:MAG: translation elongation factor Ts [Spirochaetes bacterium GWF1_51_8]